MLTTQYARRIRPAQKLFVTAAALLALGFAASSAQAQTWTKTGNPGNLPSTAQITLGTGSLDTIIGSLTTTSTASTASRPDLFQIYITGASAFSATTISFDTTIYDTQLFLFDSTGAGVYANDDTTDFAKGATLNPTGLLTPGLYFLGVSSYGAIPRSGTGAAFDMFPNTFDDTTGDVSFTGLKTPTAAGANSLTNWSLSGADVETGTYSISLTGTTYAAPVPEASTLISFGVPALLVLAVLVRRRVKPAAASV